MAGAPVVLVESGGVPVTNTEHRGFVITPVEALGVPVTLVDSGGIPVTLVNLDGSLWSAEPVFDAEDERLSWAPPELVSPVTLTVPTSTFYQSPVQASDQDVIVQLPAGTARTRETEIRGGRNVVLIGGRANGRIIFRDIAESLYVEGVRFDLSARGEEDAIVAFGAGSPDITFQNIHVAGVKGRNAGTHGDVYQPQGNIGHLRVDRMTFDSNYQGFFLRPEFLIERATIRRTNGKFNALGTPDGNTYLYWFRNPAANAAPGDPLYPVDLAEVYAEANSADASRAAVYPPTGTATRGEPSAGAYSGVTDEDGGVSFPEGSGVVGTIHRGAPSGGDFVPAASVGIGYTAATEFQGV